MTFLVLAVLFTLTAQRKVIGAQHAAAGLRRSTAWRRCCYGLEWVSGAAPSAT
jgi:hypothetical protein